MKKLEQIVLMQDEIEMLNSERGACDAFERIRIDKRIDELLSIIDCLREACE